MRTRVSVPVAAGAAIVAGVVGMSGAALASGASQRASGQPITYGDGNPFTAATARLHFVGADEGGAGTHVALQITGTDPSAAGRRFGAHVHQNVCGTSPSASGGHYQHAQVGGSLESREVWLDFTVNAGGHGHAEAVRAWPVSDPTARSVVIHALPTAVDGTAGARLACIDLDP